MSRVEESKLAPEISGGPPPTSGQTSDSQRYGDLSVGQALAPGPRGEETPGHGSEAYNLICHQGDTVVVTSAVVQKCGHPSSFLKDDFSLEERVLQVTPAGRESQSPSPVVPLPEGSVLML
ncbi:hypothetical protein MG293_009206 [Ovis ammon polii]|uniref:Uncharacterized protein n=2 Tax=Ovis TaxID=9935 RepID=A0A836A092_SHEEP|nr:hypothetical protein JEQ12_017835 [Ovis aries]KAI4540165.1 hypothetical protein MG293_009206 [Ovis ammon polii]